MNRVITLFLLPTLIWGSTWIAIKFQLGTTPAEISVFLRFTLATLVTGLWAWGRGLKLRGYSRRQHLEFFGQGAANYSLNYILTYHSESYLTSGVVAVTFSLVIYFNMLGLVFLYKKRIERSTLAGALIGGLGILLIFSREMTALAFSPQVIWGLALGVIATAFASVGNLISLRFREQAIPVLSFNFWGMFYGTLTTLAIALVLGRPWDLTMTGAYWGSLIYLSIGGTVIAFATYMTLIQLIGADRAAYSAIFTPVIALLISTAFESYSWNWMNLSGIALAILGNILVLKKKKAAVVQPEGA